MAWIWELLFQQQASRPCDGCALPHYYNIIAFLTLLHALSRAKLRGYKASERFDARGKVHASRHRHLL